MYKCQKSLSNRVWRRRGSVRSPVLARGTHEWYKRVSQREGSERITNRRIFRNHKVSTKRWNSSSSGPSPWVASLSMGISWSNNSSGNCNPAGWWRWSRIWNSVLCLSSNRQWTQIDSMDQIVFCWYPRVSTRPSRYRGSQLASIERCSDKRVESRGRWTQNAWSQQIYRLDTILWNRSFSFGQF